MAIAPPLRSPRPQTLELGNGEAADRDQVPLVDIDSFREAVLTGIREGARIAALFGLPEEGGVRVYAVLARGDLGLLSLLATRIEEGYPALTPDCLAAHRFERELAECWGIVPEGHPWLKPIRSGATRYFSMAGDAIHEVAVGPVHAGIIEPGHFRFQCHGEHVYHLEIGLGYQHRGIERALVGGPDRRTLHLMETIAGDTTVGHATAYCQVVEALTGTQAPLRALALRAVALELERLANHAGDLGALAGDIAYLPTAAYCGRLRGDFLNMTAQVCGSRFGRGLVRPGGVGFDLESERQRELLERLEGTWRDLVGAVGLLWEAPSVSARFENTGTLSTAQAIELGLVGPSARACGLERDVRHEFPTGIYRFFQEPVASWNTGDVFARAYVRWLEAQRSVALVRQQLQELPPGSPRASVPDRLPANRIAVTMVEGWRGEICHVAVTDGEGRFAGYKVVDPSFHNWAGLALAMQGQQISDFPLCNKSFNLSYCGHDL